MEQTTVDLESLVGEHKLSGVDPGVTVQVDRWGRTETVNAVRFRLDGKTYTAAENPDDGYRSSMDELRVGDEPVQNRWRAVRVVGSMRGRGCCEEHDVLELRDVKTGKVVLAVGTGNSNDYYPYFVGEFDPTALAHNATGAP